MAIKDTKQHVWEQWDWVWHVLAYGLMALNLILASVNETRRGSIQSIALLTVILALWYLPFILIPASFWSRRIGLAFFYYLLGWAIWTGLILLHVPSLILGTFFYPQIYRRLPFRLALLSGAILTVDTFFVGFIIPSSPEMRPTYYFVTALAVVTQIILSGFISALITQSSQRYRLLGQLEQTRAELARAERQAGILAERQRLAREIHDTLAQDFTSIIMHLSAARLNASQDQNNLQQAEQTARQGLAEARRIVWALRPEQLEHASLVESIQELAARFLAENSIGVETTITGLPHSLDPGKEAALLRIAQEALHNIRKHAQAQHVNLTLSYMSDLVALDIVDDGTGFDEINPGGFGLKSMRERVDELGGTLSIESGQGKGTAISVSLPQTEET